MSLGLPSVPDLSVPVVSARIVPLHLNVVKVSTPGDLYVGTFLTYRLVG